MTFKSHVPCPLWLSLRGFLKAKKAVIVAKGASTKKSTCVDMMFQFFLFEKFNYLLNQILILLCHYEVLNVDYGGGEVLNKCNIRLQHN